MTNLEKYEEQIKPYAYANRSWGVSGNKVVACGDLECSKCKLDDNPLICNCTQSRFKWLQEEYKEPEVDWSKVTVDTPILVSLDGKIWYKRYFAKYSEEKVWTWVDGSTSWSSDERKFDWKYAKLAEGVE